MLKFPTVTSAAAIKESDYMLCLTERERKDGVNCIIKQCNSTLTLPNDFSKSVVIVHNKNTQIRWRLPASIQPQRVFPKLRKKSIGALGMCCKNERMRMLEM